MSEIINPGGGGGTGTITEGVTPTSGFTDGYAITSSGGFVGQAQIRTILTGNLNLYVNASTGSDSYNGLSATFTGGVNGPTYTIQAAVNIAANNYDFVNLWGLNISCADGTIPDVGFIFLPTLLGMSAVQYHGVTVAPQYAQIYGDLTTWDNCICAACFYLGSSAQWDVEGFQLTSSYGAFLTEPAALLTIDNLDFAGSFTGAFGALSPDGGGINAYNGHFSVSSDMPCFIVAADGIVSSTCIDFNVSTITFNNSPTFSKAFLWLQNSYFQFIDGAFVNAGTVTGVKGILEDYSPLNLIGATSDSNPITRANFPGSLPFKITDGTSTISCDPCLFADLTLPADAPVGLIQAITDCTSITPNDVAAGGAYDLALIWNAGPSYLVLGGIAGLPPTNLVLVKAPSASSATTALSPAGSLLIVTLYNQTIGATTTSLTDSAGNTYTKAVEASGGGYYGCSLWYCKNLPNQLPLGGNLIAVTSSGTVFYGAAYSVTSNGTLDQTNSTTALAQTGLSLATGTLASTNEVVIAIMNFSNTLGAYTEGSGFTTLYENSSVAVISYEFTSSTSAVTWAPSWTTPNNIAACIASFEL